MNEAGSRLDMRCQSIRWRPKGLESLGHLSSSKAFTYFKRGFITLQLLVDRYIIDWPSEVELTEECDKKAASASFRLV